MWEEGESWVGAYVKPEIEAGSKLMGRDVLSSQFA